MTQGLLSLLENKKVKYKIISGCSGYNIYELMKTIRDEGFKDIIDLYEMSKDIGLGCKDCLVVMSKDNIIYRGGEELHKRYKKTFNDKYFNPRCEHGGIVFKEIIEIESL